MYVLLGRKSRLEYFRGSLDGCVCKIESLYNLHKRDISIEEFSETFSILPTTDFNSEKVKKTNINYEQISFKIK